MDKTHTEMLGEIRGEVEKLKEALRLLEEKIAALEAAGPVEVETEEDIPADFTDMQFGQFEDLSSGPAVEAVPEVAPEVVPEPVVEPEVAPEPEVEVAPEPEVEVAPEPEVEPEVAPEPESKPESESVLVAEPEPAPAPKPVRVKAAPEGTYAWQQARPGVSVKHIRSGISLLDRAQFITILFKEDYSLYDSTLADLDAMETLDEAAAYVAEHFPDWNLKSDIVFSFMMAVRKKVG